MILLKRSLPYYIIKEISFSLCSCRSQKKRKFTFIYGFSFTHIIKQKYPFPVTEDCLAKTCDKKIFTLLDLKDGLHQINISSTPDRQYEYTKLPFGGTLRLQKNLKKCLIQILQLLIRQDKILVWRYINTFNNNWWEFINPFSNFVFA